VVILNDEQMKFWLGERGIQIAANGRSMYFAADGASGFMVPFPEHIGGIHHFLGSILPQPDADVYCHTSLIWVTERGIFSPVNDLVGIKLVRQMCVSYGQYPSFDDHLRFLFDPTEDLDTHAMLSVMLVSGWDVFVVPADRRRFVFLSHVGCADVVARSQDIAQAYKQHVSHWGVSDGVPEYLLKPR
jgi:hypothetical protein